METIKHWALVAGTVAIVAALMYGVCYVFAKVTYYIDQEEEEESE